MPLKDYGGKRVFNTLIQFIKKVFSIFRQNEIKKIVGREPVISDDMLNRISLWFDMYRGKAPWVDEYIKSLRIEQGICREFSDIVLSELNIKVSNDRLNNIMQNCMVMLSENMQAGLAGGSFIIKPLGGDKYEFVTADRFMPLGFSSNGDLTGAVFISFKQINEFHYKRFEVHELTENGLRIKNFAYRSKSESEIGKLCDLSDVYEWASLPADVTYPLNRIDFGFYRNPIKNEVDGSFSGISIFDNAVELIKKADTQFGRLEWEFESGERAINVDIAALQATPVNDNKTCYSTPHLNKRLYRGLNLDGGSGDLYKEFSPAFRDENIINGLEQIKRAIEFNVGLAYGDLSDAQSVEKTATEIKHSKQRKYNRVNAIEKKLAKCLEDFCFGLAFYNGLTKSGYTFNCSFSDSILTDEETERKQDLQDVSIGAMPLWQYRMKWFNESEEVAKKMVSGNSPEVMF